MKFNKIFLLAAASTMIVSCADLDTEPMGGTVTETQKATTAEANPERVSAGVTGITTMFSIHAVFTVFSSVQKTFKSKSERLRSFFLPHFLS